MGCCSSSDAQDGTRMSRRYSDWSLPSVVHQEDSRAYLKGGGVGGAYYDGSPGGVNGGGGTSVRSLVSQSNARKWSEELFEEKMANRRQEREHSIRSNRGDMTNRSNRSYRGDATNRSHVGDLTGRSYRGGEATTRSCNRYYAGGDCTSRSTIYNYTRGDTTSRSTRSTSRIVRGEESMSSDFGGMPPQHPIRGNLTYPNIPRDASGEGSSPGEWQGHSPMPSSLPPTVPLASRSPISRRPARSPASFRRSQTASNFMPSPRSRVPLPSPRSGMPLKKVPARTAM
ncbi:hypothetical protein Pmar_PMAR017469 [Perkinsus marinus ATCC 50983]|uniref:Uncharacterized protein n=1 Tax=Perkinsus marinus (strain ATCC 50983 / TXsc) TaxID=423536 RepID=C5KG17_PERM5|nr:hypothetical protein Pmar_PMAR017469 [Perkinsus marinus ATCC 50983]EER16581.1 hypothetical protein Pmar_PMAR017469 [Perkinsus marinus ATCC 50983]|eukprot:XP_002784785.1 hypothetical protein Pmar_PMAR017469 [Perkinsus marinus ATCC 50983]